MSRRRGEFEHRTSIFEGAFRAWSHLGGLEPSDLETKTLAELDPLTNPLRDDKRLLNGKGFKALLDDGKGGGANVDTDDTVDQDEDDADDEAASDHRANVVHHHHHHRDGTTTLARRYSSSSLTSNKASDDGADAKAKDGGANNHHDHDVGTGNVDDNNNKNQSETNNSHKSDGGDDGSSPTKDSNADNHNNNNNNNIDGDGDTSNNNNNNNNNNNAPPKPSRMYPYEPLPRSGLAHPYVQAILSPWLGPDADEEAINLGLTTLRTWWQHRRKGESGSALAALGTERMRGIVDGYTRHFFNLAHCLYLNNGEQPPRTLLFKTRRREKSRRRSSKKRSREEEESRLTALALYADMDQGDDGGDRRRRRQHDAERPGDTMKKASALGKAAPSSSSSSRTSASICTTFRAERGDGAKRPSVPPTPAAVAANTPTTLTAVRDGTLRARGRTEPAADALSTFEILVAAQRRRSAESGGAPAPASAPASLFAPAPADASAEVLMKQLQRLQRLQKEQDSARRSSLHRSTTTTPPEPFHVASSDPTALATAATTEPDRAAVVPAPSAPATLLHHHNHNNNNKSSPYDDVDANANGQPATTPVVYVSGNNDVQISMSVEGISSPHCIKIIETVLRGCHSVRADGDDATTRPFRRASPRRRPSSMARRRRSPPVRGLLDAAADLRLKRVLVRIERPRDARRVADEAARNLATVGYVAHVKETAPPPALGADAAGRAALLRAFAAVAADDDALFDWTRACACPVHGVRRDDCARHAQMNTQIFEAFDTREERVREYLMGCAPSKCFDGSDDPSSAAAGGGVPHKRPSFAAARRADVVLPSRSNSVKGVGSASLVDRSNSISNHSVASIQRRLSIHSGASFGRAMSNLSAIDIDWENMEGFDVNVDHSAHINKNGNPKDPIVTSNNSSTTNTTNCGGGGGGLCHAHKTRTTTPLDEDVAEGIMEGCAMLRGMACDCGPTCVCVGCPIHDKDNATTTTTTSPNAYGTYASHHHHPPNNNSNAHHGKFQRRSSLRSKNDTDQVGQNMTVSFQV